MLCLLIIAYPHVCKSDKPSIIIIITPMFVPQVSTDGLPGAIMFALFIKYCVSLHVLILFYPYV